MLNSGALKLKPPDGDATLSAKLPKLKAGAGASAAFTCSAMLGPARLGRWAAARSAGVQRSMEALVALVRWVRGASGEPRASSDFTKSMRPLIF